jgi:DNA-binding NarL/FixJ family response regulator
VGKPIRTIIVDEDDQFVTKLATYLQQHPEIQVVGTASDGPGATEICLETLPDVVVLSLQLPVVDGVKTTQAILDINAQTGILIVASVDANDYVLRAIKMGAKGYLRKTDSLETIVQAIKHIYEGDVYVPSELASLVLSEFDRLP